MVSLLRNKGAVAIAIGALFLCLSAAQDAANADNETGFDQSGLLALLNGNSIRGVWGKDATPYRQHFHTNRRTLYQEDSGTPSWGTWRIDERGWYCSVWPPSPSETCYRVLKGSSDTQIVWATSTGGRYPR